MKVIDLLNKIAKGEEVPKKIIIGEYKYEYCERLDEMFNYKNIDTNDYLTEDWFIENILNDEVEIIEEDKDIEELMIEQDGSTYYIRNEYGTKCYLTKHSYLIADKVNELIREINKLKGKNKYE